jgi:hypothetical protein
MTWEYALDSVPSMSLLQSTLKVRALAGWRLVTATHHPNAGFTLFWERRRVIEEASTSASSSLSAGTGGTAGTQIVDVKPVSQTTKL